MALSDMQVLTEKVIARLNKMGAEDKSKSWRYQIQLCVPDALRELALRVSKADNWQLLGKQFDIPIASGVGAIPDTMLHGELGIKGEVFETATTDPGGINKNALEWRPERSDLIQGGRSNEYLYYTFEANAGLGGAIYVFNGDGTIALTTHVTAYAINIPKIGAMGALTDVPFQLSDVLSGIIVEWMTGGGAQ